MRSVRIGAGQGFYGDSVAGALDVVERGDVAYLCCDALAELTMAILERDRQRDQGAGYTRDLPDFMRALLPAARARGLRIISNAGGRNPAAAAAAVAHVARELGMADLVVGCVTGDDLGPRLDELRAHGAELRHLETGAALETVRDRLVFAAAYLGAEPVVRALAAGADVVITGRVADASLFLAPMVHELGWAGDDWDRLAAGVVLGHLMECSGQATGGNFSGAWWEMPDLDRVGYPVCEMRDDGTALLGKPAGTGGRVTVDTVAEQLLYEVHDPRAYMSPDVVADFTTVRLETAGRDQVAVSGVRGRARPGDLKVIAGYSDGWMGVASLGYAWPDAEAKALHAAELVERIAARGGLVPSERVVELVGIDSLLGGAAPRPAEAGEVLLRVAARFETRDDAERFARLAVPLALNGPPFCAGAGPPQHPRALLGVWPALVPRTLVEPAVSVRVERAGSAPST